MSVENAKVKFTGAYQLQLDGHQDARVAFQPGGKGTAYASTLSERGLVVFYCQVGATRSPMAMHSYQQYLTSKGKTQRMVLLLGGAEAWKSKFPTYKSKRNL